MDLFSAGSFVRLRNRARDKYVHADEDATHVSLRKLGIVPSLNVVWKVHLTPVEGGDPCLRLQSAAYGKYLSVAHLDEVVPSGHRGVRAVQRNYTSPFPDPPFLWRAVRVEAGQNYFRLHNNDQRCLRANGRHRHWKKLVTVDVRNGDKTTMMQWRVETIRPTPDPLPLPPPPQPPIHARRGLFRKRSGHVVHQHPGRRIRHVRLGDDGKIVTALVDDQWPELVWYDNSVSNLRTHMARLEEDENIRLCVRAGMYAHVIPLLTNLPNNNDLMEIIVYTIGSAAAAELRYPAF